jgi:hypothetical protein
MRLNQPDRKTFLASFLDAFNQYGVISVPDIDGLAHSFMDLLNEENITYQFSLTKEDRINFYTITKL